MKRILAVVSIAVCFGLFGCKTADSPTSPHQTTKFTLSITASHGSVALSPSGATYDSATTVTLTPTPDNGYVFSNWSGALTGTTKPATITMNADKSVTAVFTAVATGI